MHSRSTNASSTWLTPRVAYYEAGTGKPVVLVHGCLFSSFIWRKVIPRLSRTFRCLAPDLLGLGDTQTALGADWSLPAQAAMLVGFLDVLGLERVNLVGHDHGGAIAQLIAAEHPEHVDRLVLANCEAFDNWPSAEEKSFILLTQLPLLGPLILWLWSFPAVLELLLAIGSAVKDTSMLTPELVQSYIRANLNDGR